MKSRKRINKIFYNCPLCGSNDYEYDPGEEPYLRCQFCGYLYVPGPQGSKVRQRL